MQTWHIETNCPQCGAPVTLSETQRILECQYCKTRLYLTCRGHFCYQVPPKIKADSFIFIPFWRIKGLGFTGYLPPKLEGKAVDKTLLAYQIPLKFVSLGIRVQVLNLKFVDLKSGIFLSPQVSFKKVLEFAQRNLETSYTERKKVKKIINVPHVMRDSFRGYRLETSFTQTTSTYIETHQPVFSCFIGEVISLIYFPFILENNILKDGINGEGVAKITQDEFSRLKRYQIHSLPRIKAIPLLCPNCGWDLNCENEAWAAVCNKCGKMWGMVKERFVSLNVFTIHPFKGREIIYFPFWGVEVEVKEISLSTIADLLCFSNQYCSHLKNKHLPLYFFLPAFKINPHLFINLIKGITLAQPQAIQSVQRYIPPQCYPVTLPPQEALEALPIVLAKIGVPKKKVFNLIPQVKPVLKKINLFLIPFEKKGYEMVFQTGISLSIPYNALKWGKVL